LAEEEGDSRSTNISPENVTVASMSLISQGDPAWASGISSNMKTAISFILKLIDKAIKNKR
jgi:hypothetical protein